MINTRPLPHSDVFRWASPMVWNGELRNHKPALIDAMSSAMMTADARANIRSAVEMLSMEDPADE